MKARLQIRRHTYRGRPGFLICGTDGRGCSGISVFVRTRPSRKGPDPMRDMIGIFVIFVAIIMALFNGCPVCG